MKATNLFVAVLVFAINALAADPLTERLQRGLFEEEANRNLDAAIKEYQSVVAQSDEQRKVIATTLFRLGECYRKLGRTNDAVAFYQRIVRDYSEQEQLAKLAGDFLKPSLVATGNKSALTLELERKLAMLKVESITQQMEADRLASLSRDDLLNTDVVQKDAGYLSLMQQGMAISQKSTDLKSKLADNHPEVQALNGLRKKLIEQIDERLKVIVASAQERARLTAVQVIALSDELKKAQNETAAAPRPATETTSLTQAEAEELARVKTLARNSPDLLRTPVGGFTELQKAARGGHYSVVEFLLSQGVKSNDPAPNSSPMIEAAARGHLRIVQLLLDHGATPDDASDALSIACRDGFKSVAELLIARGADVNRAYPSRLTALYNATIGRHFSLVELLLSRGAKPDVLADGSISYSVPNGSTSAKGTTPLHEAASRGFQPIAELLLQAGASVRTTNYEAMTSLHLAANAGHSNLCALLLDRGADVNAPDATGMTPFTRALWMKRIDVVNLFLQRGANPNQTIDSRSMQSSALELAMGYGTEEILSALLAAKPKLDIKIRGNLTPVQEAVRIRQDASAILLLEAGANPNGTYEDGGSTPLHLATDRRPGLVEALLKHGANPNVLTRGGETPLSMALANAGRKIAVPGAAQSVMAPPGLVRGNPSPITAEEAAIYQRIAELLRAHGADEFLQRRGHISAVRGPQQRVNIFSKGTNDLNRYTLFEFLAAVYQTGGTDFPYPDLAKITIHRISPSVVKLKPDPSGQTSVNAVGYVTTKQPILVNAFKSLMTTNCSEDLPLEWGDEVEIPMADHSVTEGWYGLIGKEAVALNACLRRNVRLASGGTKADLELSAYLHDERIGGMIQSRNRSPFFRLSATVLRDDRFRDLLRSSSDLSRVTVTRIDPQTKETKKMTFDLNAVALPDMSYSVSLPPIPWQHDLWLREGDVIEVPEKP